ncbi:zinc finger MYND domain-containing protein 10 [Neodiprion pinetum]|uniref:zinc finger MYND domain-containing protein 10 n=1 Tax=Neodiprion pinetum TaxID=441929 RepID=UPI001EDEFDE3|nr:zinc finger MYND domain-containing protein 10 [Neodiprion pinetum]
MTERTDYIITPWEIEIHVQDLQPSNIDDIGTKRWLEFHKKLMLLNQQSVLEISTLREEAVKEWFISLKKMPVLIHEVIQINVWKEKLFPLLIEINDEPTNTFLLHSVFYHEVIACSLLENILFHSDTAEAVDDYALDLIDYAVTNVTNLLFKGKEESEDEFEDTNSCLAELLRKRKEIEFDISMKCVSILRYMAEFSDSLSLCALSRMLSTHDVPYLLTELIEKQPWKKLGEDGNKMVYNGKWETVNETDQDRMCRVEGQVWIGLREILLNPKCAPYYEITEFRMSKLVKLQKYLHETILDQISPLIELKRWLCQLSVMSQPPNAQKPIIVEMLPEVRSSILAKYHRKWKKIAKLQSKSLFNNDIEHIKSMAQVLSEAYDLDKLESIEPRRCFACKEIASNRCSKCKEAWYCGRECQVKDWTRHKDVCDKIIKNKEAYGIKD